jgi:hypothetical protein
MCPMLRARLDVAVVLAVVLLWLGGCGQSMSPPSASQPTTAIRRSLFAADGQQLQAIESPATTRPAISEGVARSRAAQAVPGATQASAVQARFVALTLETESAARQVWLVTYIGVPFVPSGCTCHVTAEPDDTVVAVDGQTGAVVLLFGATDESSVH